jgi:hypothetical protein
MPEPQDIKAHILRVLSNYPNQGWGWTEDETKCVRLAEQMLLEAKEPIEYRTELLDSLIQFNRISARDDAMGEP